MPTDRIDAIEALLVQAERAHGAYEAAELNGVYDQDWPRWYATYAVDHGIGDLIGRIVTVDELAEFLSSRTAEFDQAEPRPTQPWADHIARRIAAEL
jgi:hypothetical protein